MVQCPRCGSSYFRKNGKKKGKQNHICVDCGRQFIDVYNSKGYSDTIKRECLEMYINGMRFHAIERMKKVHHTNVIKWVKLIGKTLPDAPEHNVQSLAMPMLFSFMGFQYR